MATKSADWWPSVAGSGFRWEYDRITPSLKSAKQKADAYMSRVTTFHALRAEAYAKIHASWVDRTGNARQGLKAQANNQPSQGYWEIDVFHSMPYGFWLEVRFGGKYAIIRPTILHEAPEYWETAKDVINTMFGDGS